MMSEFDTMAILGYIKTKYPKIYTEAIIETGGK